MHEWIFVGLAISYDTQTKWKRLVWNDNKHPLVRYACSSTIFRLWKSGDCTGFSLFTSASFLSNASPPLPLHMVNHFWYGATALFCQTKSSTWNMCNMFLCAHIYAILTCMRVKKTTAYNVYEMKNKVKRRKKEENMCSPTWIDAIDGVDATMYDR